MSLTIGMATYKDPAGVWFTVQALRLYHDLHDCEILVVDNAGCPETKRLCHDWRAARYLLDREVQGTAYPRQRLFEEAHGDWVLCLDSHVFLHPGALRGLRLFQQANPDCADLIQGPVVFDDLGQIATHLSPVWGRDMWGTWATDPRGLDPHGEPFPIGMHGLGLFSCRRDAWPGFNTRFRGFGGEEGYLHAKFARRGNTTLCLPCLRWTHRFRNPTVPTPYPNDIADRCRNYLLGHHEVGLPLEPIWNTFAPLLPREVLNKLWLDVLTPTTL
jgi:glycosyltransferase involved in cell wall biosynthesis